LSIWWTGRLKSTVGTTDRDDRRVLKIPGRYPNADAQFSRSRRETPPKACDDKDDVGKIDDAMGRSSTVRNSLRSHLSVAKHPEIISATLLPWWRGDSDCSRSRNRSVSHRTPNRYDLFWEKHHDDPASSRPRALCCDLEEGTSISCGCVSVN
jgi:hypothetical protein